MYDVLIVGAGLYGATCAQQMHERGMKCLVIDRRDHIAGNAFTRRQSGIEVHMYGAHIFHTSNKQVWDYVNRFASFNHFVNSPIAVYGTEVYNLPFNMNTFSRMWGVRTPEEAKKMIDAQRLATDCPANLEEQALSLVGRDVYEKLVKGYTEKQWGRDCRELPASIIRRLPCRFTYDNNYFTDRWQGIPEDGYTAMVQRMLEGVEVRLHTDYADLIAREPGIARRVVYTGCIDEFFGWKLGRLCYRSLRFETSELPIPNAQGVAVVNYTSRDVPYTRSIEHKHFAFGTQPTTIISREYPVEWQPGMEPYYPVNDEGNQQLYGEYRKMAQSVPRVSFGGRLGQYRYYDMDQVIAKALEDAAQPL